MNGKDKSPCKGCKGRWRKEINGKLKDCHSSCERFKEYEATNEEIKKKRKENSESSIYLSYIYDRSVKRRKNERGNK